MNFVSVTIAMSSLRLCMECWNSPNFDRSVCNKDAQGHEVADCWDWDLVITSDSGGGLALGIEDARASCRTSVVLLAFSSSSFCFSVAGIFAYTARRQRAGLSSVPVSKSALSLDEYFSKFQ